MVFKKVEAQLWNPEKDGDEITGTLLGVQEDIGEYKSKLYHLETETGLFLNVFGSKVLDDKMIAVRHGDKVKIIFKGTVKGEKKPYKNYEVYVDVEE